MLVLAKQFIMEPLAAQRLGGRIHLRFWAQSLDPKSPATWAITVRLINGQIERGVLLPLTTGESSATRREVFSNSLEPHMIGPFDLSPLEVERGDRIVIELGSLGSARIETGSERQSWIEFSQDILFENIPEEIPQSRTVGECIYCHEETRVREASLLQREHVIAVGLNGDLVLQKASCKACADITSKFENEILRAAFQAPRVSLGMRTRRPIERPSHLPLVIERVGKREEIAIPVEEYPAMIATPLFPLPTHISGEPCTSGIVVKSGDTCQVAGLPLEDLCRKYHCDYAGVRLSYRVTDFARMVAKIGFAYAVLVLGLPRIAECYPLPSIRGDVDEIGRWVGCESGDPVGPSTGLHSLTLRVVDGEIRVYVRLFAQFNHREYVVVVGRIQ